MPLAVGQILENRYRIVALLGQGGMGAVYRAIDLRIDITVAIKENLAAVPEAQSQFAREAAILASLKHPNLPHVTDHFLISGQGQYLVMEYVAGEDLGEVLARCGSIPEPQALAWIADILRALEYLHARHIIHRDVKPANIKICPDPDSPTGDYQVYLVDFGLAKTYDPLLSTTIGARGVTPGYAPPEQYGMGRTDHRTDLYSVGATLYALLTGHRPPDAFEIVAGQAELLPPRRLNPSISSAVEAAILRAMQLRQADRFQSAAELRAALEQRERETAPIPRPQGSQLRETTKQSTLRPWLAASGPILLGGAALVVFLVLALVVLLPGSGSKATTTPTVGITVAALATAERTAPATYTPTSTVPPAVSRPSSTAPHTPTSRLIPMRTLTVIITLTSAPTITPTPTIAPTVPAPVVIFAENFDGPRLDGSRWGAVPGSGEITMHDGLIGMSSSGRSYPYVYTIIQPFPSQGDFRVTCRLRYAQVKDCGGCVL